MANIFHDDFRDFINALNEAEVRYILVGGYFVVLHDNYYHPEELKESIATFVEYYNNERYY